MSYIKLCYVFVKFKRTNQNAHLQKLADQSMLNGAFVIEMIHSSFSGKLLSFDKARNVLIEEKVDTWAVKSIFPLDFTKILT